MRYELLLQAKDPALAFDQERVQGLLAARKVRELADGSRAWPLEAGELEVRPLKEGGRVIGAEVGIPLKDNDALIRQAVRATTELAKEADLRAMDPQLLREITLGDEGAVADHYLRTARYAAEYGGASGVITSLPPEKAGTSAGVRVLVALGGLFFLLYLLMKYLF